MEGDEKVKFRRPKDKRDLLLSYIAARSAPPRSSPPRFRALREGAARSAPRACPPARRLRADSAPPPAPDTPRKHVRLRRRDTR